MSFDEGAIRSIVREEVEAGLSERTAKMPTILNKTIVAANTGYEIELPANTKRFIMQCRDGTTFIFAFEKGSVDGATPNREYGTVLANGSYKAEKVSLKRTSIFVAGTAGKIIEVVAWR